MSLLCYLIHYRGKERKGKERKGKERKGKERKGRIRLKLNLIKNTLSEEGGREEKNEN
jgi:hypothetical protein